MQFQYYFFLLINIALGSLNMSAEQIAELAEEFEQEIPGSVEWLHEWATAEYCLDKMRDTFDGRRVSLPLENHSSRFAAATTFYILSTNPGMHLVEYANHVARILGTKTIGKPFVSGSYETARSSLRVPEWFYNHLVVCKSQGMKKSELYESVFGLVRTMLKGGSIASNDVRFNHGDGRVRGLAHLWLRFGFALPGEDQAVELDPKTFEYVMKPSIQKEALEYMTLAFLAPPNETPVV